MSQSSQFEDNAELRQPEQRLARIQTHIEELRRLAHRGLLGLALFALISLVAVYFQDSNIMLYLSPHTRDLLGKPPSPVMINVALAVYSFSALILGIGRLTDQDERYRGWSHIGYLAVFYIFYAFANALSVNVVAVIISGLTILGLEYYSTWSSARSAIEREKEIMQRLRRQIDR
jgi:hypothetical protein